MNHNNCKEITSCIACGSNDLNLFFDLGRQPLANAYRNSPDEYEDVFPLAVNSCKNCRHVQLTHAVKPSLMFKNYAYLTGVSNTTKKFFDWFAYYSINAVKGNPKTVLDVGCNDGSQLDFFNKLGFNTYGVDPAENLHSTSTSKGHRVVCGFWNEESIRNLDNRQFDIVVSQNAFAHNPDPLTYLKLLKPMLKEHGLFFIQTSQADMVHNGEFDTIYHEHVNFYNINSMNKLCQRAELELIDVIKTPIHGVSYVFVIGNRKRTEHIKNLISMESNLLTKKVYDKWQLDVQKINTDFFNTCKNFRDKDYKLIGYGAAAKGNTLLNYAGVSLDYIIDDNPLKQNTYSPGRDIPIVNSSILENFKNDDKIIFIPLAWNVYDEIKNKIKNVRDNKNDKFLKYFPEVTVED